MNVPLSSSSTTGKKLPTIEMCMRELDREKAAQYYKDRDDGRTMIDKSGVGQIFPEATVHAHEFEPFGFSMNTVEGFAISTIHVSPQPESSYASFEAVGYDISTDEKLNLVIERVLSCFRPKQFTVAIYNGGEIYPQLQGYNCTEKFILPLGPGGPVSFFTFLAV
ncbi:S-adenosylmethionine decarboxylase core [Arabidopsis suecica]|uniref:S-adenosylmethionine decarboxylase core n=1 Tax=Arabidopsis suecica TaxID=45249 RepID=A0A8T2F895_ARASU|nr:S-adenosylmethionine decarboxylase core [Arabidopsis suecica]